MIGLTRPDGTRIRVIFDHQQMPVERGKTQEPLFYLHPDRTKNRGPIRAVTYAILEGGTKEAPQVICQGVARCSYLDGFSKETGRRLALDNALSFAVSSDAITPLEAGTILASYYRRPRNYPITKSINHQQENQTHE